MRALFCVILAAGIGNTVLRLEMEDPFTLYRLLAPLGLLAVFILRPHLALKGVGCFAAFFVYSFTLARIYSQDLTQFYPSMVHYFYLFIMLVLMIYMRSRYPDFEELFFKFFRAFYVFLIANLLIEFLIGPYYPNLYVDTSNDNALRAFYWNQNDLAVVLCLAAWFALADERYRGVTRVVVVLLTAAILYYNDSKAALLSLVLVSIPIAIIFKLCRTFKTTPVFWCVFFGVFALIVVSVLVAISDVDIAFANDTYSVNDLLIRPINNIMALESSGERWGSLNNRTDAAIFVTIEYLKSLGFGLGAGGSWLVLTLPGYELGGAKSPHNALLQFTVDFGYPVLIGYLYLLYWALRRLFRHDSDRATRIKVMAILSFPLLGLSQSGAIITNYGFFASAFFILLMKEKPLSQSVLPARIPGTPPRLVSDSIDHPGTVPMPQPGTLHSAS